MSNCGYNLNAFEYWVDRLNDEVSHIKHDNQVDNRKALEILDKDVYSALECHCGIITAKTTRDPMKLGFAMLRCSSLSPMYYNYMFDIVKPKGKYDMKFNDKLDEVFASAFFYAYLMFMLSKGFKSWALLRNFDQTLLSDTTL